MKLIHLNNNCSNFDRYDGYIKASQYQYQISTKSDSHSNCSRKGPWENGSYSLEK